MNPIEPKLESSIGLDALRIWLDFWEVTGRLRVDILRRSESGGDSPKMISPDISVKTIPAVPAILVDRYPDTIHDRAGEITVDRLKLEMIDRVRSTDRLRLNGTEHEIDSVGERDMGNFEIWIVHCHRID